MWKLHRFHMVGNSSQNSRQVVTKVMVMMIIMMMMMMMMIIMMMMTMTNLKSGSYTAFIWCTKFIRCDQ